MRRKVKSIFTTTESIHKYLYVSFCNISQWKKIKDNGSFVVPLNHINDVVSVSLVFPDFCASMTYSVSPMWHLTA